MFVLKLSGRYTNTFVEFIGQFGPSCKHADVYRIAARDGWSHR